MARLRKFALGIIGAIILGGFAIASLTQASSPYTFDGSPATPDVPPALAEWDVQVHSRDSGTWLIPESLDAQHGADCSAPPATHPVTTYAGTVFQCAGHIMTALNAGGYGVIYLTPPEMVDFANGGSVSFDLSTLRMSSRDWVDLWITPYQDNLALPFDQGDVDLQGLPRTGLHVIMSAFSGQTTFRAYSIQNFQETEINGCWWCGLEGNLNYTPNGSQRETFQLTLAPTAMRFEMLASAGGPNIEWIDASIPNLGFTKGVVQFGHHSYNPTKDQSGVPATWHWDNVSISPSVPFSIIRATQRYTQGGTVTFNAPAPANAYLRFAANGSGVTVNGQPARIQPAEQDVDRFKSYWMPIPEGTTSVTFAGQGTFNGPFFVQDVSIWAQETIPTSTPSSTPTTAATATPPPSTATSTATPIPATATMTPTSTSVPPSPTPTRTSTPTPTPTPQACRVPVRQSNGSFANVQGVLQPYGSGKVCVVP